MHIHFDHQKTAGTVIGAVLAFVNKVVESGGEIFAALSITVIVEAIVVSAIGAITGFLVTTLCKHIKNKISKS
ncbi:hypothetical protein C900_05362 [Fulvivirga imtechensis AK7]|uniref:Uncharacterized protein n=1 Tax=Fulvivirga imtechensis AK7 TaxID=1237149 RepID=L8JJT2_9BACT|nr:hypothetical protein [Fulvivirga imtechensis]ELR69166.1 hypothetical protein C900_05362 [Fulvivirga imtechensis AK7]